MALRPPSRSPNSDVFDQSAPANDEDPFAESAPDGSSYQIDSSLLRPFPLTLKYQKYMDGWQKGLRSQIQHTQELIKRPLTQPEVSAYAELSAKMISISSYSTPIGFAAGLYRAYTTASTFRFPLYQPNLDLLNPHVFPNIGLIRGHRALWAWHASRAFAYIMVNSVIAGMVLSSYAASTAAVGLQTDPRLKDINEALMQKARSHRGLPKAPVQQDRSEGRIPQDDASPTGGMYGDGGASTESSYGTKSSRGGRQEQPGSIGWGRRPNPPPVEEARESADGGFAIYDDASPTGGQGVGADMPQPRTSGSAWDRLRRGEKPTQNVQTEADMPGESTRQAPQSAWDRLRNKPQQGQGGNSKVDDSYSFPESNEQRDLARAQAQKEFDAQVERERRGGDFSDNAGDQKRW